MPLLLLRDDRGHPALVATQLCDSADECVVTAENGAAVQPIPFQSMDHWQHAGSPSWPLHPAQPYLVLWPDGRARLIVTDDAAFQLLHTGAAAETGNASPPHDDPQEQPAADTPGHHQQSRFHLYRTPVPRWLVAEPDRHVDEPAEYRFAVGDEPSWGFTVPWTFRALASPSTCEPMLEAPRPGSDQFATAYWSALLHLLVYSFGWARPDRGLRWWYDAGKPTDDPRLQLISQVWDADGQLDWFAAWLWTTGMIRSHLTPMLTELTGYHDDGRDLDVDRRWLDRVNRDIQAAGVWAPCGVDGLHLVYHLSNPEGPMGSPRGEPALLRSGTRKRQAILLLDSMTGWYRALAVHGSSLPDLPARSWHVDVIVRPVGWLGAFRRSRETGLWFAGRHRHHRGT